MEHVELKLLRKAFSIRIIGSKLPTFGQGKPKEWPVRVEFRNRISQDNI
ncbi:hypothetical protein ACMA1I_22120 [Pontibacter sp. 13R65]